MTGPGDDSDRQAETVAFLADPTTYGGGVDKVGRIDTHAAIVFLAGPDAYKIKRAVTFPFLDFSTLEKRRMACEREIEVNRLTAPELYLGTVPVVRRADGSLGLGGSGEPVEWTVHMRRFDETATLDRLAGAGGLDAGLIEHLAARIVDLHGKAPVASPADPAGRVARVARESIEELAGYPAMFAPAAVEDLSARTEAALARSGPLIEARAATGFVRRCHGDLHLGNVALIDGEPVIFDALEFDEELATIDVLYDLAFLIMDLWERGLKAAANHVMNRWLIGRNLAEDLDGLALLPLYLSMRAAIRAKVAAPRATRLAGEQRTAAEAEAHAMFASALSFLDPAPPLLVAIGGLSGTGKTTVALAAAPDLGAAPGAIVVRSDVVRKALSGVAETERLPAETYTPEASRRVYAEIEALAARALAAGQAAVLDAVHARPTERRAARGVAEAAGVPFTGLWLTADPQRLIERVEARQRDASDATAEVVRKQLSYEIGKIDWTVVDTGAGRDAAIADARRALSLSAPEGAGL